MKCPKCGKEIANDSQFCEYCGKQIVKNDVVTKVDIRWVLLLLMTLATGTMWLTLDSYWLINWHQPHYSEFAFVVPVSLFIVAIWLRIKKRIPNSLVIIMGILLMVNCEILYETHNTRNTYKPCIRLSYNDKDTYHTITIGGDNNYHIFSYDEEVKRLQEYVAIIEKKLKQEGKNKIDTYQYDDNHYWPAGHSWGIAIGIVMLVIYVIYAFMAYKKSWRF